MPEKMILDDYTFEIGPKNQIDYTGQRNLVKLDIPGTAPKYQDMGEDEHTIAWSGVFEGDFAQADCQKIDAIKSAGKEVRLMKGATTKIVRIREFNHSDVRDDYIVYSITLVEMQHQMLKEKTKATQVNTSKGGENNAEAAPAFINHTVKKGETLYLIAQKYLKDGNRWTEIKNDNKIADPRKLQIGQVLKVRKDGGGKLV